jgi:hypothetical protein
MQMDEEMERMMRMSRQMEAEAARQMEDALSRAERENACHRVSLGVVFTWVSFSAQETVITP